MNKMRITLRAKSPVVLSGLGNTKLLTVTRDVFSGTILRGLIASRYIEAKGLGTNAHENPDFRRLFFGGVRFVDAYPEAGGQVGFPLPASLQKSKDGTRIRDLLDWKPEKDYKAFRGIGVIVNDNELAPVEVKKSMTLHMSRNGETGMSAGAVQDDNIERLSGKSEDGRIYNYESIKRGQRFSGLLLGEEEDLSLLKAALGKSWIGRAGRSKYAEYGEIECTLGEIQPLEAVPEPPEQEVWLRLQTPLLPLDGNATNAKQALEAAVVNEINRRRGAEVFSLGKVFANSEPIDGFVTIWRQRHPRQTALSPGSCFALTKEGGAWNKEDMTALHALMHEGIGLRVEEGFGQLRFWKKMDWQPSKKVEADGWKETSKITSDDVKQKAEAIVRAKRLEHFRLYAAKAVAQSKESVAKAPAHVFVRLDKILMGENRSEEAFQGRLRGYLGENETVFSTHLKNIRIALPNGNKEPLYDLLLSKPSRIYENQPDETEGDLQGFYKDIGKTPELSPSDVFSEYWHWFFRHARKTKADKETGEGADV